MVASKRDPLEFYAPRILVSDFARSWKFYREVLGLTPQKGNGSPPYGEFIQHNRPIVSIFHRSLMAAAVGLTPGRYPATQVGQSMITFGVRDVDAVARRLRQRKIRLVCGPTDRPMWQLRTIHLRDPDGYLIEIFSPLRASPPK
jgi:lactoylglutathione lyase